VAPLTVMCPECQDLIEIQDPEGLVRALHLLNACSIRNLLSHTPDEG
jgi:hypothetical protein